MGYQSSAIYLAGAGAPRQGGRGSLGTGVDPRHVKAAMQTSKGLNAIRLAYS